MIEILKSIIAKNAKAIVAYFTTLILGLLLRWGVDVPSDVVLAAQSFVVAAIVWLTRNRE